MEKKFSPWRRAKPTKLCKNTLFGRIFFQYSLKVFHHLFVSHASCWWINIKKLPWDLSVYKLNFVSGPNYDYPLSARLSKPSDYNAMTTMPNILEIKPNKWDSFFSPKNCYRRKRSKKINYQIKKRDKSPKIL